MTRKTIKLAIEALKAMRQKIAIDARIGELLGELASPYAQKAWKKYQAIDEAIKELEAQP